MHDTSTTPTTEPTKEDVPAARAVRAPKAIGAAPWGPFVLAVLVGAGAGLGSIVFRWLIKTFTQVFTGHADYSDAGHAAHPYVSWLGPYFVLFAPVLGGLLYGPLVDRFAKEARGHGVPEVMLAVAQRGGRIKPIVSVVKSLASALTIGSGGSVGREGPIVQIGSALGSTLGRVCGISADRLRLLVACGAAGGIAATFNAPLAGVFFAMELILGTFSVEAFGATVLSSVTASVIGRAAFGDAAFLNLPPFHVDHLSQYALFALLGAAAGAVGTGFTRILYLVEDVCDWAWRGPEWLRPAVGGVLLGVVLLALPEMYGVGYPVLEKATEGHYTATFLLLLLAGKILAASLTIGIGGSGGVFAPSLFVGAMLGGAYGIGAHHLLPGAAGAAGAYALVGMGAVFAGAARAPITAVVILFELTGQYSIILPLMLAIVIATLVSRLLCQDTVYTLKLRRRGIDLTHPGPGAHLASQQVAAIMEEPPPPLPSTTALAEACDLVNRSAHAILPVIDAGGRYLGVLTRAAVEALAGSPDGALDRPTTAGELARPADHAPVTADMSLSAALHVLVHAPVTGLPVLDEEQTHVVGWLTPQAALRELHQRITSPRRLQSE